MNPVSHFFIGWLTVHITKLDRRERMLITLGSIIPDLDGLVIIGDYLTRSSKSPLELWGKYHHVLGHNIGFAIFVTFVSYILAKKRKLITSLLVWISFHLHLLGDLVGSRGPEGYQWPIPYLMPFSNSWQWTWEGQWALNAWPNILITIIAISISFYLAWRLSYSPLGIFSYKADKIFIITLHNRFGEPNNTNKD